MASRDGLLEAGMEPQKLTVCSSRRPCTVATAADPADSRRTPRTACSEDERPPDGIKRCATASSTCREASTRPAAGQARAGQRVDHVPPQPLLPPRAGEAGGIPEALRCGQRERMLRAQRKHHPQQALALANSTLVETQSKALAGKLSKEGASDDAFLELAVTILAAAERRGTPGRRVPAGGPRSRGWSRPVQSQQLRDHPVGDVMMHDDRARMTRRRSGRRSWIHGPGSARCFSETASRDDSSTWRPPDGRRTSSQGQDRHLVLHDRRDEPHGELRPQAGTEPLRGQDHRRSALRRPRLALRSRTSAR